MRRVRPLCERCVKEFGALHANTAKHMHHIQRISDRPDLRMERSNWLSVCVPCHEVLEKDVIQAMAVKAWSEEHYDKTLRNSCVDENLQLKQ